MIPKADVKVSELCRKLARFEFCFAIIVTVSVQLHLETFFYMFLEHGVPNRMSGKEKMYK